MHGAYEELSGVEIARTYLAPGENTQTDFHKHSWYSGEDYWDDCNLYGMPISRYILHRSCQRHTRNCREQHINTVH